MNPISRCCLALVVALVVAPIGAAGAQEQGVRTPEDFLAELGLAADSPQGSGQMSREEVAVILARLMEAESGNNGGGQPTFEDVPSWAQGYVALEAGLTGTPKNTGWPPRALFEDYVKNFDPTSFSQRAAYSVSTGSTF